MLLQNARPASAAISATGGTQAPAREGSFAAALAQAHGAARSRACGGRRIPGGRSRRTDRCDRRKPGGASRAAARIQRIARDRPVPDGDRRRCPRGAVVRLLRLLGGPPGGRADRRPGPGPWRRLGRSGRGRRALAGRCQTALTSCLHRGTSSSSAVSTSESSSGSCLTETSKRSRATTKTRSHSTYAHQANPPAT